MTVSTLLQALGFSKGCAELAPKNPPPLVPRCLMGMSAATGPREINCVCALPPGVVAHRAGASRVVASAFGCKVIGTPSASSSTPMSRL